MLQYFDTVRAQIALLAPGPSMSESIAKFAWSNFPCGVINNCFELVPNALFLAANDRAWWNNNPAASKFSAMKKFSVSADSDGVEKFKAPGLSTTSNSGVLALEVAKSLGAKTIFLLGFDMHGSHFFGPYTNGCANTPPHVRRVHFDQYRSWAQENQSIRVVNCTPKSHLDIFERGSIYDFV